MTEPNEVTVLAADAITISTWHGESGTLYYVIEKTGPEEEDWDILATFGTLAAARKYADDLTTP